MSRLLAALKNLQDRGEFVSPPPLRSPDSPDGTTADPIDSGSRYDGTDAANAPRNEVVEARSDDARSDDARPALGESGPPTLLPIPPVLDVGLISCGSSPADDDVYEAVPVPSALHDTPANPSVTDLVDSLLEQQLAATTKSTRRSGDETLIPAVDADEREALTDPDPDAVLPVNLEIDGKAVEPERLEAEAPPDSSGELPGDATRASHELADVDVQTLPFERPDPDATSGDIEPLWPTLGPADDTLGIGAMPEPWVDDPPSSPAESRDDQRIPNDHDLPVPPVRHRDAERPRRSVEEAGVPDTTQKLPDELPQYETFPGHSASPMVAVAPPQLPEETVSETAVGDDQAADSERADADRAVQRQPVDMTRIADLKSESRVSEYRGVAARLWLDCQKLQLKSVLLTGIADESHLAEIAASLAITLAEVEQARVLLVDGDVRDRRLTIALNQTATPGFAGVFDWESSFIAPAVPTSIPRLDFIPAGQPRCSIRRADNGLLAEKISELARQYDLVLIDGGSLPALPTELLADACDATYPVVRLGKTKADEAMSAVATLRDAGGRIPGCIATDAQRTKSSG